MIEGLGIDVVDVTRVQDVIGRWGDRFLEKIFTESELRYARSKKNPLPHFAGRFAVKEAVAKALSTGWAGGFRWKDVEVENDPSGKPSVRLHGTVKEMLKGNRILVSISHSDNTVVACAIIESVEKG